MMDHTTVDYRVVKVGGSLLGQPGLGERIAIWLKQQTPASNLLVVGGGRLVDQVRALDRTHSLGESAAHQICIVALSVTARVLVATIPGARLVSSTEGWGRSAHDGAAVVLDVAAVLEELESSSDAAPLPRCWRVTSDAIAAQIARLVGAQQLVLLKSADPPQQVSIETAAAAGYVDSFFHEPARGVGTVRFVNFRHPECREWLV